MLYEPNNSQTLIQNYVKDIAVDPNGNVIVATFKGVSIYDKGADTFIQLKAQEEPTHGLNNNFVNSLYADTSGTIWIGKEKGGVNQMQKKSVLFHTIKHDNKK